LDNGFIASDEGWTVKDWRPLGPHHSLVDERCCDALAGANLEAGAHNHAGNGIADTARGNGQRCRG